MGGPDIDRRRLLALLGGTTTVALAGCTGDGDDDDPGDGEQNGEEDPGDDEPSGDDDSNGEDDPEDDDPNGAEAGVPEFDVSFGELPAQVQTGESLTVEYTVENIGDAKGTTEAVTNVGETTDSRDITVPAGGTETVTVELTPSDVEPGTLSVTVAVEAAEDSGVVAVVEPIPPDGEEFTLQSTGGFAAVEGDTREEAQDASLAINFPPSEDNPEPVVIEGVTTGEGRWQSTSVYLPDLVVQGFPVDADIPGGLQGDFDPGAGVLTVVGRWVFDLPIGEETIEPDVVATTDESGGLEGSFDVEEGTVTIVDNETEVEATGTDLVDGQLELPSEPGEFWLEVDLEIEGEALENIDTA